MNPNDPNMASLELVAKALGTALLDDLVFVGGAVVGLLITDPAMPAIRATDDVDTICQAVVRSDYYRIEANLRQRGFVQDMSQDAPICRWRIGEGPQSVAVDVMPTLPDILGFSNRWYPMALETARTIELPSGRTIRLIEAPVFLATKLEAFENRGRGDYLASHDLEDVVALLDGRASLLEECRGSPKELRAWLADRMQALLNNPAFVESLPGHLPSDSASQARLPELHHALRQLASMEQR